MKNKKTVEFLIETQKITNLGFKSIEIAKNNGSWWILDNVENLIVPELFKQELLKKPKAEQFYQNLSNSQKKSVLQWIILAKKEKTKMNRIHKFINSAEIKEFSING